MPALNGQGVLVTRPAGQQAALVAALTDAGATVLSFPVIEIVPRARAVIETEAGTLDPPDISIFVSANAVEFGIEFAAGRIAAIGPATAAAIEAAGKTVDLVPEDGFSSEDLLGTEALHRVAGKTVRIIRGSRGRELLAETLSSRGAAVQYLGVYDRRLPAYSAAEIDRLETHWRAGEIDVIVVMSVESFDNLTQLLPESILPELNEARLVTPAKRVLKEIEARFPGADISLAEAPDAGSIVEAVIESLEPPRDLSR
ncbi:MAG: uroporphyrinogen-III synthase [Woeseiaceae bacterium]|jgi:uroporphyrinogen-III synthase|nr:uroporphyrinogen-III synthase [Woeseiaceae bacterium]